MKVQQERNSRRRRAWDTAQTSEGQRDSLASERVEGERLPEGPEDTAGVAWSQKAPGPA